VNPKADHQAVYKEIGRRIELLRVERRISQKVLGSRLRHPLTRAAISNMEGGRQGVLVHVLLEIADVLQVPLARLLPANSVSEATPDTATIEEQLRAHGITGAEAARIVRVSAKGAV
jgi:transcriptional regulator with XRE-family HTH domain